MAKNITLAVDEEALAAARVYAAQRGTTVNALVREYLAKLPNQDDRAARARRELVELAKRSTADLGPDYKWNREELYDRAGLRGHERADVRGGGKAE